MCFLVEFAKSLRTPFLRNISGWLLPYVPSSDSEDYLEKPLFSFFPSGINWKCGTLIKSSFILDLRHFTVQFRPLAHFLHIYSSTYNRCRLNRLSYNSFCFSLCSLTQVQGSNFVDAKSHSKFSNGRASHVIRFC